LLKEAALVAAFFFHFNQLFFVHFFYLPKRNEPNLPAGRQGKVTAAENSLKISVIR